VASLRRVELLEAAAQGWLDPATLTTSGEGGAAGGAGGAAVPTTPGGVGWGGAGQGGAGRDGPGGGVVVPGFYEET
jgi:hypothetical protein